MEANGNAMTAQQGRVYEFLLANYLRDGVMPSTRELADQFTMTVNGVSTHLRALSKKGLIEMARGKARAIKILGLAWMPIFDSGSVAGRTAAEVYSRLAQDRPAPDSALAYPLPEDTL